MRRSTPMLDKYHDAMISDVKIIGDTIEVADKAAKMLLLVP